MIFDNKNACSNRKNKIFLICMIHSHRNNFVRRKTMRDTWLSENKLNLLGQFTDEYHKLNREDLQNLELVHMFIVGSGK